MFLCAMCTFETDDEAQAYAHDCMKPTESDDSEPHVHKVNESAQWWAQCFPQHTKGRDNV